MREPAVAPSTPACPPEAPGANAHETSPRGKRLGAEARQRNSSSFGHCRLDRQLASFVSRGEPGGTWASVRPSRGRKHGDGGAVRARSPHAPAVMVQVPLGRLSG